MKILTTNFLTCAVKACKASPASYPLHFQDAELEQADMEYNPAFLRNILPRIEWDALRVTATELGFTSLPVEKPDMSGGGGVAGQDGGGGGEAGEEMGVAEEEREKMLRELHRLLLETQDQRGDCEFLAAEPSGLRANDGRGFVSDGGKDEGESGEAGSRGARKG
ncbi:hypothetical protein MMC32_001357 [Xylographa parallela]|nr:hypothetical protein [Xylographa parallela]